MKLQNFSSFDKNFGCVDENWFDYCGYDTLHDNSNCCSFDRFVDSDSYGYNCDAGQPDSNTDNFYDQNNDHDYDYGDDYDYDYDYNDGYRNDGNYDDCAD